MAITDDMLERECPHLGGVQRLYRLPNAYRLSLVNSPVLHAYPFAWEAAVMDPDGRLNYETPLTADVEVFDTDEETDAFIRRAKAWAEGRS